MKHRMIFAPEEGGSTGGGGAQTAAAAVAATTTAVDTSTAQDAGTYAQESAATTTTTQRPEWAPEKFWENGSVNAEKLARSYSSLEQRLSQRGITVPGEGAAPEEVAAYRQAVGIPDAPESYQLKPDTLPEGITWSDEQATEFARIAHESGMTQAQAQAAAKWLVEREAGAMQQAQAEIDRVMQERETALKRKWGPQYAAKIGLAKQVVANLGFDPSDTELFGNPKTVEFLGAVVSAMSADAVAGLRGAIAPASSGYASSIEEATAIIKDPSHPLHQKYHSGDQSVIARVRRMYDSPA